MVSKLHHMVLLDITYNWYCRVRYWYRSKYSYRFYWSIGSIGALRGMRLFDACAYEYRTGTSTMHGARIISASRLPAFFHCSRSLLGFFDFGKRKVS